MDKRDRYRGALIGEAAGDALGYTVEFPNHKFFSALALQALPITSLTSRALRAFLTIRR